MARDGLSDGIRNFAAGIPSRVNEVKKQVATVFLETVVPATPMNTGRARNGWVVGIGSPSSETPPEGEQTVTSIGVGSARIEAVQPGQAIHIGNNLSYIGDLNSGSSVKAPAGFVEAAFNEAKAQAPVIKAAVAKSAK